MRIERIVLRRMKMKLKTVFTTSFGSFEEKYFTIAEVHGEGHVGYGECAATYYPLYNEETYDTAYSILRDVLIPRLRDAGDITHPSQVREIFSPVRRNNCAKATLDCAIWDLWAKCQGLPLYKALGGVNERVRVGVSIGIQASPEKLVEAVDASLRKSFRRVKFKIKPGRDIAYLDAVRSTFPDIDLQLDANSAYTLKDIDVLKQMDKYNLLLIEQPLAHDDIVDHRILQSQMQTPICLDESIDTVEDARKAIELGSTRVINIKVARVGGLSEAKLIHDLAAEHNVPVWCGGMLDAGIAKAHNIAIATLPNYRLASDIVPSDRFWQADIVDPLITMNDDSTVTPLNRPGIGYAVDPASYEAHTISTEHFVF